MTYQKDLVQVFAGCKRTDLYSFWEKLKHGYVIWRASNSRIFSRLWSTPGDFYKDLNKKTRPNPSWIKPLTTFFGPITHGTLRKVSHGFYPFPTKTNRDTIDVGLHDSDDSASHAKEIACGAGFALLVHNLSPLGPGGLPWDDGIYRSMDGWLIFFSKCR